MAFIISSQPQALTAVPGQDVTFSVTASTAFTPLTSITYNYQWYVNNGVVSGATNSSFVLDPVIEDNGDSIFAIVTVLSGTTPPLSAQVTTLSSDRVTLTVQEDSFPFNVYDVAPETGRQRHLRLRLLGYI